MKTKLALSLGVGFLLALVCGNLYAQSTKTTGETLTTTPAQPSCSTAVNPDILVVTGRILDAETKQPIKGTKINFDRFGDEMLKAGIDADGNYSFALNKKELGEPVRIVFKISGYKRFVVKSIDKKATHLEADIFLEPTEGEEKSNATVKYVMSEDPFNTMVIKMQ